MNHGKNLIKICLLASCTVLFLLGCSKNSNNEQALAHASRVGIALDSGTAMADYSQELISAALDEYSQDKGIRIEKELNTGDHSKEAIHIVKLVSRQAGADAEQILRVLSTASTELVIVAGEHYASALKTVAPLYPQIQYIFLNATNEDVSTDSNIHYVIFNEQESSFLVGLVGGLYLATKNDAKLAIISKAEETTNARRVFAYNAGLLYSNPDMRKKGALSLQTLATETTPQIAEQNTAKLKNIFGENVEIAYSLSYALSENLFRMATELDRLAIGTNATFYEKYQRSNDATLKSLAEHIMGTTVTNIDAVFLRVLKNYVDDKKIPERILTVGLAENAVDFRFNPQLAGNYPTIAQGLADVKKAIIAHQINIPTNQESYTDFVKGLN